MPAPARNETHSWLTTLIDIVVCTYSMKGGRFAGDNGFWLVRPLCISPAMTFPDMLPIAVMLARPGQHLLTKVLMWFMYSCWQWLSVKKESLLPPAHQSAYCSHRVCSLMWHEVCFMKRHSLPLFGHCIRASLPASSWRAQRMPSIAHHVMMGVTQGLSAQISNCPNPICTE